MKTKTLLLVVFTSLSANAECIKVNLSDISNQYDLQESHRKSSANPVIKLATGMFVFNSKSIIGNSIHQQYRDSLSKAIKVAPRSKFTILSEEYLLSGDEDEEVLPNDPTGGGSIRTLGFDVVNDRSTQPQLNVDNVFCPN